MLPKKKRVTKELFQEILKSGRTLSGYFFVFRYIKQDNPQYAFVVSKKIAKKAVDRNKLRRQGYNALSTLKLKGYLGVFFYKKEVKGAIFKDIKEDIGIILDKLR